MSPKVSPRFLLSVVELNQLPADNGKEIAFIGYSNAGKSSAINVITRIKGLAKTSKTPGRTQAINIFKLDEQKRFVDLPGYGYTKAPAAVSRKWIEKVNKYLQIRQSLCGLILVMDIRHPLKKQDQYIIAWAVQCNLPVHILLNKSDKLKRGPALNILKELQQEIKQYNNLVTIQLFSAHKQTGLDEVQQKLTGWFTD